jgi:preprotein translocase subunit SecD
MKTHRLVLPSLGLVVATLACAGLATPTPAPYTVTLVPAGGAGSDATTLNAAVEVINARLEDRPTWGAQASAGDGVITVAYGDPDARDAIVARATAIGLVTMVGSTVQVEAGDACPSGDPVITNADVREAEASVANGQWQVAFTLTESGAERFGAYTTDHNGGVLAICRDAVVLSAPVINTPITGGEGVIAGSFTQAEGEQIASELNAGALPIPLEVLATTD